MLRKNDFFTHYDSPLGGITLCSDGEALTGLLFDNEKYITQTMGESYAEKLLPEHEAEAIPAFAQARRWLDIYFGGTEPGFTPPIAMRGTPFQTAVWEILREIPYGQTTTYGQIAARIAQRQGRARMSAQAVGSAVGRNPISLIVPCHRVIGADGSLTGYAGGVDKKAALLTLEGREEYTL